MTTLPDAVAAPSAAPWWRDPWVVRWLAVTVLAGAVLRVAAALELATLPFFELPQVDAGVYEHGARRIAAGDLALVGQVAGMGPGYFYVLGTIYAVCGHGPWAPRVVQHLVGLVAVVLVYDASRRVVGTRWAMLPAFIASAYAPSLFFESQLLGESLAFALHAAALDLILATGERAAPSRGLRVGLGAVIGIAALFRPTALVLLAPAAGASGIRRALPIALGAALAIAPITARNVLVAHEPVLITGHGGLNLWIGNGPGATGAMRLPREIPGAVGPLEQFEVSRAVASRAVGRPLSISEADRYWTWRTITWAAGHPLDWLATVARKLHLYVNAYEPSDVYRYEFLRGESPVLRVLVPFALVAPLALVGLLAALAGGTAWPPTPPAKKAPTAGAARLTAFVALVEAASVVAVFVCARYRLPTLPAAFVLTGLGARELCSALRHGDARRRALVAGTLALGIVLAWHVRTRPGDAAGHCDLATAWSALGETGRARDEYRAARRYGVTCR